MSRDCCVTLPQYAMGLSAVYDFLIILTIFKTNPSNFTFCKYTWLFTYWVIFHAFLLASAVFFSINFFFIKICQEYHQSVKQFWSRSGPTLYCPWSGSELLSVVDTMGKEIKKKLYIWLTNFKFYWTGLEIHKWEQDFNFSISSADSIK